MLWSRRPVMAGAIALYLAMLGIAIGYRAKAGNLERLLTEANSQSTVFEQRANLAETELKQFVELVQAASLRLKKIQAAAEPSVAQWTGVRRSHIRLPEE